MSYTDVIKDVISKSMESDAKTPIVEWEPRSNRFRIKIAMDLKANKQGDGRWRSGLRDGIRRGVLARDGSTLYLPQQAIRSIELKYSGGYVSVVILQLQNRRKIEVISADF